MKFLVPNCSCLQNRRLGGATTPQIPYSLSSTEFVGTPTPKKISEYATGFRRTLLSLRQDSSPA